MLGSVRRSRVAIQRVRAVGDFKVRVLPALNSLRFSANLPQDRHPDSSEEGRESTSVSDSKVRSTAPNPTAYLRIRESRPSAPSCEFTVELALSTAGPSSRTARLTSDARRRSQAHNRVNENRPTATTRQSSSPVHEHGHDYTVMRKHARAAGPVPSRRLASGRDA